MKTIKIFFRNLALVMTVCSVSLTYSQSSLQKAQELKNNYEFQKAINEYTSYFSLNPAFSEDIRELVECYKMVNDLVSAEIWLEKIISSSDYTASDLWNYASALKSEGKYQEAIVQFNNYALMDIENKSKAATQIEGCELALQWLGEPVDWNVFNEKGLNSSNSEFGLIKFDKNFILTSDRVSGTIGQNEVYGWTGKPYLKMYAANETDKLFSASVPLTASGFSKITDLNNKYHNGPGIYSASTSDLIFTRTKMVKLSKPVNGDPTSWSEKPFESDYVNRLEIFTSSFSDGKWGEAVDFEFNKADEYSVGHPAITSDGKTLYFVSDMPGGYGSTDIYYCEKLSDGTWTFPMNAGSEINTEGKEVFPYIDANSTLFFSSDGHAGMGGLDIYKSVGQKDSWSEPENMKCPINSSMDDFSIFYTIPGQYGYFASNREGGLGDDDIYSFNYSPAPPKSVILAITTKEKLDDNSIVDFPFVDLTLKEESQNNTDLFKTDNTGHLYVEADCFKSYALKFEKEGYFTQEKIFETNCKKKHDTIYIDLVLEKIVINKPIVLNNIYYDFDKWFIRPDAALELDKLVSVLNLNPDIVIELGSHCDSRGTNEYNDVLSQNRAESAVSYIISEGIDASRITSKGYGKRVLINKCSENVYCTEAEHQLNRRTEFKVTSIKKN